MRPASKEYLLQPDTPICGGAWKGWQTSSGSSSILTHTIKIHFICFVGLLWEGDGFLLLYKRLDNGAFNWPRTRQEALEISADQYRMLMQGFEIVAKHPILQITSPQKEL